MKAIYLLTLQKRQQDSSTGSLKNRNCGLFLKPLTKVQFMAVSHSFFWSSSDEGKPHCHVNIFNLLKHCPVGRANSQ